MLKSFQNGADKDNLLSYFGTDKVMQAQAKKMSDAQAQADDDQAQLEQQRLMASPEFKQMKKKMRVRHADGTTGPASDAYILDQLMRRRAVQSKQNTQEGQ